MFRYFILLTVMVLSGIMVLNQPALGARIEGFEPDYAGRTIEFMTWTDPVSKNERTAFVLTIGPQGRIQVETGITELLFCYADFDSYRGKIVVVPGQTIKIKLPPLKEKSFEESKNPYFKPVELWMPGQVDGKEDLTTRFARFDRLFYGLQDRYFDQLYYRQQRNFLDSMRIKLDQESGRNGGKEIQWHRQLMLKTVEAGMLRAGREKLMGSLRELPTEAWIMPAFADLTDRLLTGTLSQESKSAQGAKLKNMVTQRDLAGLKKWTETLTGTTSPLSDLLLVKMLHDAFYSGDFSKNSIFQILQLSHYTGHSVRIVRTAAAETLKKLQHLHPGTEAPVICLPSPAGDTLCSSSAIKPFQYILFADLEIPVCREQVKYLADIHQRIGDRVDILLVLSPSSRVNNADFIAENKIPGRIVTDNQALKTGKTYRIRSYPSALLLNREHKVVLAPAKTPLDGFELQLGGVR